MPRPPTRPLTRHLPRPLPRHLRRADPAAMTPPLSPYLARQDADRKSGFLDPDRRHRESVHAFRTTKEGLARASQKCLCRRTSLPPYTLTQPPLLPPLSPYLARQDADRKSGFLHPDRRHRESVHAFRTTKEGLARASQKCLCPRRDGDSFGPYPIPYQWQIWKCFEYDHLGARSSFRAGAWDGYLYNKTIYEERE